MGTRWDGTTPTDTRSQRSRTSRRGGQLLTRARSPPCKNGLPIRVPRRPLFRTVAPYARRKTPGQQNNTRAPASFHTGYQRDRVAQREIPASDQGPRPLPERAVGVEVSLPSHPVAGPHRRRSSTMDDAVEASAQRVRDHLQRPLPGGRTLLMDPTENTVREIDPPRALLSRRLRTTLFPGSRAAR